MKTCGQCAGTMHGSSRHPVCLACRSSRACSDCGIPVSYRSTGRCRLCAIKEMTSRPGHAGRQAEAMRKHNRAPENADKRREAAFKAVATKRSTPEGRAAMVENGRNYGAPNIRTTRSAESRAKAGASISAVKLRDVPAGYRDLYRSLRRGGSSAAEALAMTRQQASQDEKRRVAAMTPFERQMEAVSRGAALVAKPDFRIDFTLGGVSSGQL